MEVWISPQRDHFNSVSDFLWSWDKQEYSKDFRENKSVHGFPWKKIYDKPRQHIKKQKHHFADKSLRESIPRQFNKKSRGPHGERGLEFSRREGGREGGREREREKERNPSTFLRIV